MGKQNTLYSKDTMECYLASERKGILIDGTTGMNLEGIVLLEKGRRSYSMEFQIGKVKTVLDMDGVAAYMAMGIY